ncbi:MAG: RNA pseudouridine synthase [Gammaproteobacteria bacterium]
MRLDKRLVELIHCSRGEAQKYIEGGWVQVDGEVEERPQFKVQDQKVELHADATLAPIAPVTLLLNLTQDFDANDPTAPLQLITVESHSKDDYSGIHILNNHFSRLKPTLPLQDGATGLLVFTKDVRVLRRLGEDNKKIEQEYVVEVSDEVEHDVLNQLNTPITNEGRPFAKCKVSKQSEKRLRFALESARPGQIEVMCKNAGLTIVAMKRIRIGRVSMKKLLPGQWRYLATNALF